MVHINLRPSAILLTNEDVPKLFELEMIESVENWDEKRHALALMGSGLAFAAPEELTRVDRCSTQVDVYRIGAILYMILAGQPPFAGDPQAIIDAVLHRAPPRPQQLNRDASREVEAICLKCLEKRPERRYTSLQDLAADLRILIKA